MLNQFTEKFLRGPTQFTVRQIEATPDASSEYGCKKQRNAMVYHNVMGGPNRFNDKQTELADKLLACSLDIGVANRATFIP